MTELWRAIPGAPIGYEVSDQGRVRSPRKVLKPVRHVSGYLMVGVGGRCIKVHRLVAEAFIGPRPDGLQTCHENGDRQDNRLVNLRYDTASSNGRDMRTHGTDHQLNKTHCPQGHAYTPDNICWLTDGGKRTPYRKCKTCHRERMQARRDAARAIAA